MPYVYSAVGRVEKIKKYQPFTAPILTQLLGAPKKTTTDHGSLSAGHG